jgi:replication initiation protein RepC
MQTDSVTTPFGQRSISLALIRRQAAVDVEPGKTADKWKIKRDASAAMGLLGLQSNSLAVLDALLSFYPDNDLRQDAQLVVFPSNLQLSLRAHGMAGSTLRRHLGALVEAGLIIRRDSANGKRYARKSERGDVESAFGFDLSPLLARAEELAMMAQEVTAARSKFRKAKEDLTICRRDVRKLISAAMEEDVQGGWAAIESFYIALIGRLPRNPTISEVESVLEDMELLKEEIVNRLILNEKSDTMSGNDAHIEQHIQNSNTYYPNEIEPSSRNEQGAKVEPLRQASNGAMKAFPLGLVLKACPQIVDYSPGGGISNWRDLMSAAIVTRSMLGISPSAYQDACEIMGAEHAAVAVACILERANMIKSPGGYLRNLTQRTQRGEFSLGPMLMALLNSQGFGALKVG